MTTTLAQAQLIRDSHARTVHLDVCALNRFTAAKYGRPLYMRVRVKGAPEMIVVGTYPVQGGQEYSCVFWSAGQRSMSRVCDADIREGLVEAYYEEDRPDLVVVESADDGRWSMVWVTEGLRDDPALVSRVAREFRWSHNAYVAEVGYRVLFDARSIRSVVRPFSWRSLSLSGLQAAREGKYDEVLTSASRLYLIIRHGQHFYAFDRRKWPSSRIARDEELKTSAEVLARSMNHTGEVTWIGNAIVEGAPSAFYEVRASGCDTGSTQWVTRVELEENRGPGVPEGFALLDRVALFGYGHMGLFTEHALGDMTTEKYGQAADVAKS